VLVGRCLFARVLVQARGHHRYRGLGGDVSRLKGPSLVARRCERVGVFGPGYR
jgi:hypothetical protein